MGMFIDANCDCGYRESMALGSGFVDQTSFDKFPYLCADCSEIVVLDALDTDPRCEKCGGQSLTSYGDPSMFVGQRLSHSVYARNASVAPDILQADSADAYADAIVCREREDDDRCRSRVDLESFFRLKRLSEDFSVVDLLFQQGLSKDDVWSILDSLSGFIFRDGKDQDFDELRRWHIEEYEAGWAKVRSGQSGAIYDCAYPCPKCGQRSLRFEWAGLWD